MPATIVTTKRSIQNNKRDEKQIEQPWLRKHKLMIGDEILFEIQEKERKQEQMNGITCNLKLS
jgi:hypothetical protein